MTTMETLLAEVDLLHKELEGLYQEKKRVDGTIGILLGGAKELEAQVEDAQQERFELLLAVRRVNSLYGPFEEFTPWLKEEKTVSVKRALL